MSPAVVAHSMQGATGINTKEKSRKKDKDRTEKKSSKKRRREEDEAAHTNTSVERAESPSKRLRSSSEETPDWRAAAANANGNHTPIHQHTASFYLPLSPISLRYPLKGLCAEHLSPLILTYYPPLDGVILGYSDARLSSHPPTSTANTLQQRPKLALAQQIDEYAPSFVWLTASFLVMRLVKDIWLDAVVNLQNESHLGLIVWNLLPASIPRERLPKDWRWRDVTPGTLAKGNGGDEWASDEHGYFIDGEGKRLPRQISFRVKDFEAAPAMEGDRGFVSIGGTLLDEKEEGRLERVEEEREKARREKRARDDQREVQVAGISNGDNLESHEDSDSGQTPNRTGGNGGKGKHRLTY